MSPNHCRADSRSPSSSPPMKSHIKHHHPRQVPEITAVRHQQQRKQIILQHLWHAYRENLRAAQHRVREHQRAPTEEDFAESVHILDERWFRDPGFAYKMRYPVYAEHKLRETINAVRTERRVRAHFVYSSHSAHAIPEFIV